MGFWANLWSFATAAGTLALAGATYAIIRQGKEQRQDAERQHRERLKPVCVLVPVGGVDPLNRRGELLEKRDPHRTIRPSAHWPFTARFRTSEPVPRSACASSSDSWT